MKVKVKLGEGKVITRGEKEMSKYMIFMYENVPVKAISIYKENTPA